MKIVVNKCFGGFGLSKAAYEKLIEYGVPVKGYLEQERSHETGLYLPQPANDGEIVFDRRLSEGNRLTSALSELEKCPYWDTWTRDSRNHPLLVRVVEELGNDASGRFAKLEVVEIPDDVEWEIDEYDGNECVAEKHRTWS